MHLTIPLSLTNWNVNASLKAKGRQEYHHHRTMFYPWGKRTALENRKDYQVEKILLYPESSCLEKVTPTRQLHFTIVEGAVEILSESGKKFYQKGESAGFQKTTDLKITNPGLSPSILIKVQSSKHDTDH